MTLPALLLGILVSTLMGAAFHLWKGGGIGRLVLYLLLAWVGFWIGHILASVIGWTFGSVGPLHLGMGVLVGAAILGLGYWLSLIRQEEQHP
jgi:hypothetical protein